MTIGQRIAEKRKELGLSQEALGQELGVSRQSVYKWESDAALPEIDKLVALSRRFGVTVGWLLGVEEPAPTEGEAEAAAPDPEELAERIAKKYIEALPKPAPRKPIVKLLTWAAAIGLLIGGWNIFQRLDNMENNYQTALYYMSELRSSVGGQIGGITQRVEEILKGQNQIAADYSAAHTGTDIGANRASFSAMVLPREEPGDLVVRFTAEYGGPEPVTVDGIRQPDGTWRADLTCPLSDGIQISAIFESGGTLKNQRLEYFTGLYSETFPGVDIRHESFLIFHELTGDQLNKLVLKGEYTSIQDPQAPQKPGTAAIREIRVGFFKNRELVCWLEPIQGTPPNWHGFDETDQYYRVPDLELTLEESDRVCLAAVVTDEYGRELVWPGMSYMMDTPDKRGRDMTYATNASLRPGLEEWKY